MGLNVMGKKKKKKREGDPASCDVMYTDCGFFSLDKCIL